MRMLDTLNDPKFEDAVNKIIIAEKHAKEKGLYEIREQEG